MKVPKIEEIEELYYNKYLKLYGMHFDNNAFYLECSRRDKDNLTVNKNPEEYRTMAADAVTIVLVVKTPDSEPRLYLEHEFRYPTGHFLLSPPAGLIDSADLLTESPCVTAAKREIKEETGIDVKDSDKAFVVSPLFFSSPGMTDESNAIVCVAVDLPDLTSLTDKFSETTECFDGYSLVTKSEAKDLLKSCRDENGLYFSIFTWGILMYFAYMFE